MSTPTGCNQYGHAPGCGHPGATGGPAEASGVDLTGGTPSHLVEALRPDAFIHVGLGPGRAWGTLCETCGQRVFGDDTDSTRTALTRHRLVEHSAHGTAPAAVDEWVVDENAGVRVSFTDLGEGYEGDYDPEDPEDRPLLRIDVHVRPEHPSASVHDDADDGWCWPQGEGSLCTYVDRDRVTPEQMRRLLNQARADLVAASRDGYSISGVVKGFQAMSAADAPREPDDAPTPEEWGPILAEHPGAVSVDWCETCNADTAHHRAHAPWSQGLTCIVCDENGPSDDEHLHR